MNPIADSHDSLDTERPEEREEVHSGAHAPFRTTRYTATHHLPHHIGDGASSARSGS